MSFETTIPNDPMRACAILHHIRNAADSTLSEMEAAHMKANLTKSLGGKPEVTDMYFQSVISIADSEIRAKKHLPRVRIKQKLSDRDYISLSETFSNYHIDNTGAYDVDAHAFARAVRVVSEKYLLDLLNYKPNQVPTQGYDNVLKDVGSNPHTKILASRMNVHSCCPVIDGSDELRNARYRLKMINLMDTRPTLQQKLCLDAHVRRDEKVICHNLSQNCTVKCPQLLFLHSAYDMSPYEMGLAMCKANAHHAVGVIHYDPVVQRMDFGEFKQTGMCFEKKVVNGTTKIKFWFRRDTQNTYEHDYRVYISHLSAFRIVVETPDGVTAYAYDIVKFACESIFFEMHRLDSAVCPRSHASRVLTDRGLEDKTIIQYHDWTTLADATFFPSQNHSKRKTLIVPTRLMESVMAYAATLPPAKFLTKTIQNAAHTMNTRVVINGASVVSPERLTPAEVDTLAHIVFVMQYISNYENNNMVAMYLRDENDLRTNVDSFLLKRYLIKVKRLIKNFTRNSSNETNVKFDDTEGTIVHEGEGLHTPLQSIDKLCAMARQSKITIDSFFPQFLAYDEYLSLIRSDDKSLYRGYETIDGVEINDGTDHIEIAPTSQALDGFDIEVCPVTEYKIIPNKSQGHCIFQSFVDHGLIQSIEHGKHLVRESIRHRRVADIPLIANYLENEEDQVPVDKWPPLEMMILLAYRLSVRVCVHMNGFCQAGGPRDVSTTYHFDFAFNHLQAVEPLHKLPDVCEYELSDAGTGVDVRDEYNPELTRNAVNRMFAIMRKNKSASEYRDAYSRARLTMDKYSTIEKCGYLCRSAVKTAEILYRYFDPDEIYAALSFGGPGGEIQVLHQRSPARVYGVTQKETERNDFSEQLDFGRFEPLYGVDATGNVLNVENQQEIVDVISETGIDWFGCDLADTDEGKDVVLLDHLALLRAQWKIVSEVLLKGGGGYFKLFTIDRETNEFIRQVSSHFHSALLVKLLSSRCTSSEIHLVLRGYSAERVHEEISKNRINHAAYQHDVNFKRCFTRLFGVFGKAKINNVASDCDVEQMRVLLGNASGNLCGGLVPSKMTPTSPIRGDVRISRCCEKKNVCHEEEEDTDDKDIESDISGISDDDTLSFQSAVENVETQAVDVVSKTMEIETVDFSLELNKNETVEIAVDLLSECREDTPAMEPQRKNEKIKTLCRFGRKMITTKTDRIGDKYRAPRNIDHGVTLLHTPFQQITPPLIPLENVRGSNWCEPNQSVQKGVDQLSTGISPEKLKCEMKSGAKAPLSMFKSAIHEYESSLRHVHKDEVDNLQRFVDKTLMLPNRDEIIRLKDDSLGVIDPVTSSFVTRPRKTFEKYAKVFAEGRLHEWKNLMKLTPPVVVNAYTQYAFDEEVANVIQNQRLADKFEIPETVRFVQAGPGCGKTYKVVNEHDPAVSVVVLSTKEGQIDFLRRVKSLGKKVDESRYRTLMSVLLNSEGLPHCRDLYVDEALMHHPGAIFSVVALLKPKSLSLFGDRLQIPFVNRSPQHPLKYLDICDFVDVTDTLYISYRIPCDIAYRFSDKYKIFNEIVGVERGLMSTSANTNSACVVRISSVSDVPVTLDSTTYYLTFTQSEKDLLKDVGITNVSTVHEFQGKEADCINVVRLRAFEKEEIYLRESYALVAATRHRRKLIYYTTILTDALSTIIAVDNTKVLSIANSDTILEKCHWRGVGSYSLPVGYSYTSPIEDATSSFVKTDALPKDALRLKPSMSGGYIIGKKTISCPVGKLEFSSMSQIVSVFLYVRAMNPAKKYYVRITDMEELSPMVVSNKFYAIFGKTRKLFIVTDKLMDVVDPHIFSLLNVNALSYGLHRRYSEVECEEMPLETFPTATADGDISLYQMFLSEIFADTSFADQTLDDYMINHADFSINTSDISFVPIRGLYEHPRFDRLTPSLSTVVPSDRSTNLREVMLALNKRNKNVPDIQGTVSVFAQAETLLNTFVRTYIDENEMDVGPIEISADVVSEWLATQDIPNLELLVPEVPLEQTALNVYDFSIKRKPKPNLTVDATAQYLSLQTILFHPKYVNAIFCGLFKLLRNKIMHALKGNVLINTDMSTEELDEKVNHMGSTFMLFAGDDSLIYDGLQFLEVDLSKYDKSQGEIALEFECSWMRYFGVPEFYVHLWYNAHVLTFFSDKTTGMRGNLFFQRKSGDASTFFGNTMYLMAVLSTLLPLDNLVPGVVKLVVDNKRITDSFSLIYNLEAKIYSYHHAMFCSKFVVRSNDRWYIIPDPVKLLVKLGRRDIVNDYHLDCVLTSLSDHTNAFQELSVLSELSLAVCERYHIYRDLTLLLNTFFSIPSLHLFDCLSDANIDSSRKYFSSE